MLLLFLVVLLIGSAVEKGRVDKAPSTDWLYATPEVCATNSTQARPVTYASLAAAHAAGAKVAHCGGCGQCRNAQDIGIYRDTRNTLTATATSCAMRAFLGRSHVSECFADKVGFSPTCNDCWTNKVMCDLRSCTFTCLQMIIFRQKNNVAAEAAEQGRDLNACLLCDEKLCGAAFTLCAGANRRRAGIVSDIGRDESSEQCTKVDTGWAA